MKDSFISNYMSHAIELAKMGIGFTNPNPLVGAVIVKNGKIIGEGFHEKYGGLHAERNAIADAVKKAGGDKSVCAGAEIYVTLEPCCHTGKQPPCTAAIIEAGIKKVYVGSSDPNPLVAGKGISILREAGIEVVENIMRSECDAINKIFFHYITTKTPYVILKYAMSANGVISVCDGVEKNISGATSYALVHKTRSQVMAVMTGINTVIEDDPMLNCRIDNQPLNCCVNEVTDDSQKSDLQNDLPNIEKDIRQPIRIVCDTNLRIPLTSRLVRSAKDFPLIVACSEKVAVSSTDVSKKVNELEKHGAKILRVPCIDGNRIDLCQFMKMLGEQGIDSILLESGGVLSEAMLRLGLVQKIQVYVSPKFFGACCRKNPATANAMPVANDSATVNEPSLSNSSSEKFTSYFGAPSSVKQIGDDVLIEYEVGSACGAAMQERA